MRKPPNERLTSQPRTPAKAGGQKQEKAGSRLSPGNGETAKHVPERKCILSGRHAARDNLIRLALGPDGQVAPDVRARAPGRGAWIGVDRATLQAAREKGKLKGALARAFRGGRVVIPEDLGERIEAALRQNALDRLGLEARAGTLITGSDKIEVAARQDALALGNVAAFFLPRAGGRLAYRGVIGRFPQPRPPLHLRTSAHERP